MEEDEAKRFIRCDMAGFWPGFWLVRTSSNTVCRWDHDVLYIKHSFKALNVNNETF